MDLSKAIIAQIDVADRRQFDYAMEAARKEQSGKRLAIICGALIAVAGYGATTWLAIHGQSVAALSISLPLTTVLAMVIGNRFLE